MILHAVKLVRDRTRSAEDLIHQTRTRPLMKHRQPAELMGYAVQVEEPVGCDARVCQEAGTRDALL